MTVLEFLKSKGVPTSLTEGKSTKELNALARAVDPEFKAPAVASATIQEYTPEKGKAGVGMYLVTQIGSSRESFSRLCDGKVLTEEGAALAISLAHLIVEAVEGQR